MTLVEVTIATALFALASVAASYLLVWAAKALWDSAEETPAVAAAQGKLEELQSRAWHFDAAGARVSDPALATSPLNALIENVDGYVDYLDEQGQHVGAGPVAPESAAFVRRWSVRPLAPGTDDSLLLEVLVVPLSSGPARPAGSHHRPGTSRLATARTRVR
jgi:hypothetical protein